MSEADGKIYITISDKRLDDGGGGGGKKPDVKTKDKTDPLGDFAKHQFFNFIESEAKQMTNYTIQNIGNFTGDYNAQRAVNFGMSAANVIKSIAIGTIAGAKLGGPIGALIGVTITTASQAINFGLQLNSESIEIKKQNRSVEQMRQLSGLDGRTNGSRI